MGDRQPWAVVNAFLDDDERRVVVVERGPGGERRARRVRAEHVTWHRAEDLTPAMLRQLSKLEFSRSIRTEGAWVRVGWDGAEGRRAGLRGMRANGVASFEGDVDPVLLWLVEGGAPIARPRRCYLDVEADSRVQLSRKEEMRILSWAVVDHDTGEELVGCLREETDAAERELLRALVGALAAYDQVCVWEGDWKGGEFDSVVVPARCRMRSVDVDALPIVWLNQLAVWKKMNMHSAESGAEKESFKLEDIAYEQVGEGKEPTPDFVRARWPERSARGLGGMTWELWEAGGEFRDLLLRYNARDARLLRKLELRKKYVALFETVCQLCGIVPEIRSLQPTRQMDGFMLRLGREHGRRYATKVFREGEAERDKFKGALVIQPKTLDPAWRQRHGMSNGILRDVHVCDFAGMYPSMMLSYNLGAEAKVGTAASAEAWRGRGDAATTCYSPGTGLVTRVDEPGMVTLALRTLIAARKEHSDRAASLPYGTPEWHDAMSLSTASKVVANSFYGAQGSPYSRFFDRDVSEATTQNGVHFLRITIAEAEKRGMHVVYGDTDGLAIIGPSMRAFAHFVDWLNQKRFPDEVASHGCRENHVKIAFEKSFSRITFTTAKRYCGTPAHYKFSTTCERCTTAKGGPGSVDVRTLTCRDCGYVYERPPRFLGKPEIKGLEYKRGDRLRLARELQGRVIDMLVGGVRVKGADGVERPANPGIETPTEDLSHYAAAIEAARDRVFGGELPVEEVRQSKALSMSLREYGRAASQEHVRVARMLVERGRAVARGLRIEFVVVDAAQSPMVVIPAEDYEGQFDRIYLWKQVYGPTAALLGAAFPDENWARYEESRPKKRRGRSAALPGQLGLVLTRVNTPEEARAELAVAAYRPQALEIVIPRGAPEGAVERVREAAARHPGQRRAEIVVETEAGGRTAIPPELKVLTGTRFEADVQRAITGS